MIWVWKWKVALPQMPIGTLFEKEYYYCAPNICVGFLPYSSSQRLILPLFRFANAQWGYVVKKQATAWGRFVDKCIPDAWEVLRKARVTVSAFPESSTAEFPPYYKEVKKVMTGRNVTPDPDYVPVITMGRYGAILKKSRPSDDAFVAMLDSAQHIIRLTLQDLGPLCFPGTKFPLPGCDWPHEYLGALARVIWTRGVDVEIVLSNPGSVPGDLDPGASYGYGWSCVDVAAEIIKSIQKQFPDAHDGDLRLKVENNLHLCMLKSPRGGSHYKDGGSLGLHCKLFVIGWHFVFTASRRLTHFLLTVAKHFMIDDICCYIGSQNLYVCDLAEWGVVIDDPEKVQDIKAQYWDPMWKVSYTYDECEVDEVMDGLKIDRRAPSKLEMTKMQIQEAKEKMRASMNIPAHSKFHSKQKLAPKGKDEDDTELSEGHC
jgi:phosphatidylserine/phosphatidylglycerophosphate/cardiolipin synthase-like enzyme